MISLTQIAANALASPQLSGIIKFLGWIKSDGTQVVVNEDNPLPVTGPVGGILVIPQTVNVVSVGVSENTTGSIPIGAKGWTFTVRAGTATFNGVAGLPAGFSDSDPNTLAVAISYTTAAASTAYVRYNT